MTEEKGLGFKGSFAVSLVLHALFIGMVALFTLMKAAPTGGTGTLTIEFGGPAGSTGGNGDLQRAGQQGNLGSGDDGALRHAQKKLGNDTAQVARSKPPVPQSAKAQTDLGDMQTDETTVSQKQYMDAKLKSPLLHVKGSGHIAEKKPYSKQKTVVRHIRQDTTDEKTKKDKTDKSMTGAAGAAGKSGTLNGAASQASSGVGNGAGELSGNHRFIANGDGTYTALGSGGITYKIITDAAPRYPKQARSIGFNNIVRVRVRFLVGLNGTVETVNVMSENIPDLGFKASAISAIKTMKFQPIWYKGYNIKVFFVKTIIFQP